MTTNQDEILKIYVDGASRSNPGPAAFAYILIKKNGGIIHQNQGFIGKKTNNVAEYTAIIQALKAAEKFTTKHVEVYSDSELIVKQLNKEYRVKASHLSDLRENVYNLCQNFKNVKFLHVRRTHPNIQKCDFLCNKCLDETR